MLRLCFTQENDAIHAAYGMHRTANESYKAYVEPIDYLGKRNRDMAIMGNNSIPAYLERNDRALREFKTA